MIKDYFLNYDETLSNDFVLNGGGQAVELLSSDTHDWRITFVDTGLRAKVGERLKAVQSHLAGDEMFLANYGDVLTNAHLPAMIENLEQSDKVASMLCTSPNYTFHVVTLDGSETVQGIQDVTEAGLWISGGFFVLRNEIFDYIRIGEDLVVEPFQRLIHDEKLLAYRHLGFWAPMDTLKDKTMLEDMLESGEAPWRVWDPAVAHDV